MRLVDRDGQRFARAKGCRLRELDLADLSAQHAALPPIRVVPQFGLHGQVGPRRVRQQRQIGDDKRIVDGHVAAGPEENAVPDADVPVADRRQPVPFGRFDERRGVGREASAQKIWSSRLTVGSSVIGMGWISTATQFFRPATTLSVTSKRPRMKAPLILPDHLSVDKDVGLVVDAVEVQPYPLAAIILAAVPFRPDTTNRERQNQSDTWN